MTDRLRLAATRPADAREAEAALAGLGEHPGIYFGVAGLRLALPDDARCTVLAGTRRVQAPRRGRDRRRRRAAPARRG